MATNPYFNNGHTSFAGSGEQDELDKLTIEIIKMAGQDMLYVPREFVAFDDLLGEDVITAFNRSYGIEMYLENTGAFKGDGDILGKFGLQIMDDCSLIVSRTRFMEETGVEFPNEGDLIYFPLTRTLLEIKFVEHENPFYQLGKLTTFKLSCELFRYSYEEFDTGVEEIDDIEDEFREEVTYDIEFDGEIIIPEFTIAPSIVGSGAVDTPLTVDNGTLDGSPEPDITYQWRLDGINIVGETSNTYTPTSEDLLKVVTCRVTATNIAGSVAVTTNGVIVIDSASYILREDGGRILRETTGSIIKEE